MQNPKSIQQLIDELSKLPSIGLRSAQRIAYFLIDAPDTQVKALANAMITAKQKITKCKSCFCISEQETCEICNDISRDRSVLCVIEDFRDLMAIEKTHEFKGLYHVLGGSLNPLDGIGPDKLTIEPLLNRVKTANFSEVIICTSASVNGEATAMYLSKLLKETGVKITRLAYGIPIGAELDSTDEQTIASALTGRREMA